MLLAMFSNIFKSFNEISSYRHVIIYIISIYLNVLNIFQYNPSISMFPSFQKSLFNFKRTSSNSPTCYAEYSDFLT